MGPIRNPNWSTSGTRVTLSYLVCHRSYIIAASPRFLCRPTAFCSTCWSCGTSGRSPQGKQRICRSNSGSAHFHVSWLSDFIFYPKPLYKSLHQSFFYSFITILFLPSERLFAYVNNMIANKIV